MLSGVLNITFFKNRLFLGGSRGIFGAVKIVVFYGFHTSLSISTIIIKRKMLAPSVRSLSKALNSELSIEPSTKGLAILVQKLCSFSCCESATF